MPLSPHGCGRLHDHVFGQGFFKAVQLPGGHLRVQHQIDAVDLAEMTGEFLKGGDVGDGDPAAFGQCQAFGVQYAGQTECAGPSRMVEAYEGPFLPAVDRCQGRAGDKCARIAQQGRHPFTAALCRLRHPPRPQRSVEDRVEAEQEKRFGRAVGRSDIGGKHRGGGPDAGPGQYGGDETFGQAAAGPGEHPVRTAGHMVHAAGKGVQGRMNGQAYAGENGRTQGHAEQHGDRAARVGPQVAHTEPDEQPHHENGPAGIFMHDAGYPSCALP